MRRWLAFGLRIVAALAIIVGLASSSRRALADDSNVSVMRERTDQTARIVVIPQPGLESLARDLEQRATAVLAEISADLDQLPAPKQIEINLVHDASDLARVAPQGRGAPAWAVGVAYPDLGIMSVATRRGSQIIDVVATTQHELAHLALGAALGDHAPHWLHEGFAYQHSSEWSFDRTETLAGMSWFGGLIALDELDSTFPKEEMPANRAYAEAYDFVGYLARRGRYEDTLGNGDRGPFRRFLAALSHGATLDQAAMRSFGKPIHALFDEWRDNVHQRYLWAPVGVLGLAVWVLCAFLLFLGYLRKRRHNRARIAQWDREERREVFVPPYVPWPGVDPLDDEPDEDGNDPKLLN